MSCHTRLAEVGAGSFGTNFTSESPYIVYKNGLRRSVMLTPGLGTHVGKLYSASTLQLSLSASRSWDGGLRASASTQPPNKNGVIYRVRPCLSHVL
jgi:hypothetical protein